MCRLHRSVEEWLIDLNQGIARVSMKKRWIISAAATLCLCVSSWAQQDPQFTQFMFDRLSVNSGYAGFNDNICATALLRQQWSGFEGAPKTGLFNIHGPIAKYNMGVGLTAYYDKLGQEQSTIVRGHVSYHFKNVGKGSLGVGVYGGLTGRSLDGDWVSVDPVSSDLSIPENGGNASGFDLGAGLYYETPDLWVGISSTQLPETELKEVSIQNAQHYYLQAGYKWAIKGNKNYILQPSTLLKSDGSSTQWDLNVTFLYNNQAWLGVTYRTEDAIAPMIGYHHAFANGKGALRLGYSYDVTTSDIKNYSSGSHEVMLSYCFKIEKPEKIEIYRNPRFL